MTDDAPFEPPPPEEPPRCPSCLAPVEPDQEFCLECGARLETGQEGRGGLMGRRGAAIVAAVAALLLIGGFAIAWGFTRDDSSKQAGGSTTPGTIHTGTGISTPSISTLEPTGSSIPTITGLPSTATSTVTVTTAPTSSSSSTDADCGGEPSGADDDSWPNGTNGWMAILSSKPVADYTFADFCARLHQAADEGYTNLGIIDSTDYADLNPGYWVLYIGPYSTSQAASAEAVAARPDWPGAYPRQVNDSP